MADVKLNERQAKYSKNRARGIGRQQSAVLAGYSDSENAGFQVEESAGVKEEIARLQAETAADAGVTKDDVAEGLKAAATMAQIQGDAQGMVAAWRELGKLLGFYAPEVKKIQKGFNKSELKAALSELGDEELLRISNGRVIDGKFTREATPSLPDLSKEPAGS